MSWTAQAVGVAALLLAGFYLECATHRRPDNSTGLIKGNEGSPAKCAQDRNEPGSAPDLLMCKSAAHHNSDLLKDILAQASEGLVTNANRARFENEAYAASGRAPIIKSITRYYAALAMRARDLALSGAAIAYMHERLARVACTSIIDHSDTIDGDGEFIAPLWICTEATYVRDCPDNGICHFYQLDATELVHKIQHVVLQYMMLGSEFHEGAVAHLLGPVKQSIYLDRPSFGYEATQLYGKTDAPSLDQLKELLILIERFTWNKQNEPTMALIARGLVKNLNRMAQKDVDTVSTWNETFFASYDDPAYDRSRYEWAISSRWARAGIWLCHWNLALNCATCVLGRALLSAKQLAYLTAAFSLWPEWNPLHEVRADWIRSSIFYAVIFTVNALMPIGAQAFFYAMVAGSLMALYKDFNILPMFYMMRGRKYLQKKRVSATKVWKRAVKWHASVKTGIVRVVAIVFIVSIVWFLWLLL